MEHCTRMSKTPMIEMEVIGGEKAHATFGASASERWLACPGSIQLGQGIKSVSGRAADEGTDGHTCLETLLKNGPEKCLATSAFLRKTYPTEMVMHAEKAAREIWKRTPKGAELLSETRCDLTHIDKDAFGTTDAVIIEPWGYLEVIDYKYGWGVVEPKDNPQMIFYGLAVAHAYDYNFKGIKLTIMQPRAPHEAGPIRTHVMPMRDLMKWEKIFSDGIKAAKKKDAPRKVGDWCRYCPAIHKCPERSTKVLEEARAAFSAEGEIHMPEVKAGADLLAPANIGQTLTNLVLLEEWIAAVRKHAEGVLKDGGKIKGWALVPTRPTRKWINAEKAHVEAMKVFGSLALTKRELLSPAQLEEIPAPKGIDVKAWVKKRCASVSSGVKLAPESDNNASAAEVFGKESALSDETERKNKRKKGKDEKHGKLR